MNFGTINKERWTGRDNKNNQEIIRKEVKQKPNKLDKKDIRKTLHNLRFYLKNEKKVNQMN
jgi:translation initiation factor IF-3